MTQPAPMPMRVAFGQALARLGHEHPRLVVLDADVSSSTQTRLFAEAFPDRFFNFGIAEANMVAAAAGLAASGLIPVVSTFAFLLALRAADPLRSLVAYNGLDVKLVGGYAGLSDHADGASHQAVEDIAIMRAIPGITVVAPGDLTETEMATAAMLRHPGPVYLRLSRQPVPRLFGPDHPFVIGRGLVLRPGHEVTLAATGTMVPLALAAAERLADDGIDAMVLDLHTVKPLDEALVMTAARETGALVTIEEHSMVGGLGEAVAAALAEGCPAPLRRCGIPDRFGESGDYDEILARAGLSVDHVVAAAREAIAAKPSTRRRRPHAPR